MGVGMMAVKISREDGRKFDLIGDPAKYVRHLQQRRATEITAEKIACLLARKSIPGQEITVWTEDGCEAVEIGQSGFWTTISVTPEKKPILNSAGKMNIWQQSDENLRKKYDVENMEEDGFVRPKGGPQRFIRVDEDIALMKPWGKNGELVPQFICAGGWLNITDISNVYGIGAKEFEKTYRPYGISDGFKTINRCLRGVFDLHLYEDEDGFAVTMVDITNADLTEYAFGEDRTAAEQFYTLICKAQISMM